MKATDNRFLMLHPRTAKWYKQRVTCERCQHCSASNGSQGERILRCQDADPIPGTAVPYCIDAREPGTRCGPTAKKFQPKE